MSQIDAELKSQLPLIHGNLQNDCYLVAQNVHYAIDSNKVLQGCKFKRILFIEYKKPADDRFYGHVVLVFVYPAENYTGFYIFDEDGTRSYTGSPFIAKPITIARVFFPNYQVINAFYATN